MASDEEETLYCLCRKAYQDDQFMIECEVCKDWFHGSCVDIKEHQATDIEIYHCPNCQINHGPLVLKRRRNFHRRNYAETDDNINKQTVQTGTVLFIQELKQRTFPSADEIPIVRTQGYKITKEFLIENGFDVPILVEKKDGLDLTVPPPSFTIQDVENHVGSMREIDVIDVAKQEDYKMLMREWTEYYNSPNRQKVFNVISLEFTKTKLADLIDPPRLVKELSWVSNHWPSEVPAEDALFQKPEVQRYCLMGVKDSFTDFHVDFGGTSVWYHVLRGEKIFYLIRPTSANLSLYESWASSSNQSEMFFGDQVDACYKCVVKKGQTLFIPTGWIHAVLTPIDSLVFGGNFIHSLNIDLQIQVYEIEKRIKTPEKYMFPNYETVHWYAAKHVLDTLKEHEEDATKPPLYLVNGAKSLATALKSWTHKKEYIKRESIPETIQYGKLLKELQKVVKHLTDKKSPKSKAKSSDKKKEKKRKDTEMPSPVSAQEIPFSQVIVKEPKGKAAKCKIAKGGKSKQKAKKADGKPGNLKLRLPKAGASSDKNKKDISVYDFTDDLEESKPMKLEHRTGTTPPAKLALDIRLDDSKKIKFEPLREEKPVLPSPGLKLKVSGGKIVSESAKGSADGKSELLSGGAPAAPIGSGSESEDQLVVDETPKKKKLENTSRTALKPGSLKLKLSVNKNSQDSGHDTSFTSQDESDEHHEALTTPEQRMNMPTIQGGLNGSISDILEASGYGTETDIKIDGIGRASPTMRDAIQGMLSMSRMGGMQLSSSLGSGSLLERSTGKPHRHQKMVYDEDTGERMPTCYKDQEYVYPTLDVSDNEDEHVFKPRGRVKKDETWNPKAKLQPNCPAPERPLREGTRRESVEHGLAAAAAKLANMPPPKRQYVRKKKSEKKSSKLLEPQAGTSGIGLSSSAPASLLVTGLKRPAAEPSPSSSKPGIPVKKAKKGMATAKQRLGKILKIHKMGVF